MTTDALYRCDCISGMSRLIPDASVDLVFADPPFNIGVSYESPFYDNLRHDKYVDWSRKWIAEAVRVLRPGGSLWIANGAMNAADMVMIGREHHLAMRNYVTWHYSFGVNQRKKFTPSHVHILYYVKPGGEFTFNADAVRVPSARQTKYNDKRAHPLGRVPDDVWTDSRVCGTFRERVKWHPCQMPESVLERIILATSHAGDIVLDPFAGSGTTLAVAKRCGRRYVGFELSESYCTGIAERLRSVTTPTATAPARGPNLGPSIPPREVGTATRSESREDHPRSPGAPPEPPTTLPGSA